MHPTWVGAKEGRQHPILDTCIVGAYDELKFRRMSMIHLCAYIRRIMAQGLWQSNPVSAAGTSRLPRASTLCPAWVVRVRLQGLTRLSVTARPALDQPQRKAIGGPRERAGGRIRTPIAR